jgi:hypothetical protein
LRKSEHHGIDLGDGNVIHYSSDASTWVQAGASSILGENPAKHASVQIESMDSFTRHGALPVTVVQRCKSNEDADFVVWRAMVNSSF